MSRRIFIGGIGRSGTTILYRALGSHANIHAFPREMRFLTNPDGLMDLMDALTHRYSQVNAREALHRFEVLMRIHLAHPQFNPYRGFDFPAWLGGDTYWQRLDRFCDQLIELEYAGQDWLAYQENGAKSEGRLVDWARRLQKMRRQLRGQAEVEPEKPPTLKRIKNRLPRYFSNRAELAALTAGFVDDLFLHAAHLNGKETWCEKSPDNFLHLDFLWELFPDSLAVIIRRDPRGVVYSMTQQHWAPDDLEDACLFVKGLYQRWDDLQVWARTAGHPLLEIKLEDLAADPHAELHKITSASGLPDQYQDLPSISLDKVNYWQDVMTRQEIQIVEKHLGHYIEQQEYLA